MTDFEVKDGACIIPGGEKKIGYRAFRDCEELKSIVIPNSVKMIEASAFEDCTGLTEITIPDSVTVIEGFALPLEMHCSTSATT